MERAEFAAAIREKYMMNESLEVGQRFEVYDALFHTGSKLLEHFESHERTSGTVYCLTNFNSTIEQDLYRIYTLRDLGFKPYVMVYNKPSAPKQIKALQRWCNNVVIFRQCKRFENYKPQQRVSAHNKRF